MTTQASGGTYAEWVLRLHAASKESQEDDLLDQLGKYLPSKLMDRVNEALDARQTGASVFLSRARDALTQNTGVNKDDIAEAICFIDEAKSRCIEATWKQQAGEAQGDARELLAVEMERDGFTHAAAWIRDRSKPLRHIEVEAIRAINTALAARQPNEPGVTLFLDLDGVMADFDGYFEACFGNVERPMPDEVMWPLIFGHHTPFFRSMPPMAGAVEFFRAIEHFNPVILTACPKSNYAEVAKQKREWVREHLSKTCMILPVLGGENKPLFMHQSDDILIDDYGKNCRAWNEAGGRAIKHEGDWQNTFDNLLFLIGRR